ncbi:MAG TPA: hypothetical protein VNZ56_05415 [Verrucomicrobiae bacterium]|jgi:hypothetical protein|nr:hypothetical protein [Verrucomicrobiae bacterium]
MNSLPTSSRTSAAALALLSAILFLGIVQWSFLPILIQNGPVGNAAVLEMTAGHSAKFAAPFKGLFSEGLNLCLVPTRITVRRFVSGVVRLPDAPVSGQDDFSLTHRPLRAPPSA